MDTESSPPLLLRSASSLPPGAAELLLFMISKCCLPLACPLLGPFPLPPLPTGLSWPHFLCTLSSEVPKSCYKMNSQEPHLRHCSKFWFTILWWLMLLHLVPSVHTHTPSPQCSAVQTLQQTLWRGTEAQGGEGEREREQECSGCR